MGTVEPRALIELKERSSVAHNLLKAMSNKWRLLILCHLVDGERSVGELQKEIGLNQSALSQHLAILRRDKFVETRRQARTIYYSLGSDDATSVMALLYDLFCRDHRGDVDPNTAPPALALGAVAASDQAREQLGMSKTAATKTLNIKGLTCPRPLMWARSQIDSLKPGETLGVLATDPTTVPDIQAFCRSTGHELVETSETDGVIRLLVKKSG